MYFKQIDSFRFFAVLLVLISHWLHEVPYVEILRFGAFGVEFFFVLSGFLISLQLYRYKDLIDQKKGKIGNALYVFYIRRIIRILPLYYFVVLIATLLHKGEIRDAFLWNLSCVSNFYFIKIKYWTSTFSHFWSLSVEEHFYLFWPLLVFIFKRRFLPIAFVLIICWAVLFRYNSFTHTIEYFRVYAHTISCLDLFIMGAVLAYLYHYYKSIFHKISQSRLVKIFTLVGFVMLYYFWIAHTEFQTFNWVFQRLFMGVIYLLIIGIVVNGIKGKVGEILENKALVKLGKLSYGIYLIHNFVPGILLPIKKLHLHFSIEFGIYFIVTIIFSEILYRFIEVPFRKLNKRFVL